MEAYVMEYLIGLEITGQLGAEIIKFRASRQYPAVTPHIELISHKLLSGAGGIKQKLQSFCLSQPEFKTIIGGPNIENNEYIFLTVLPGAIDVAREKLLRHFKLPADQRGCRSNLALIRPKPGESLSLLLTEAKQVFLKPHAITMESASLYGRESADEPFMPITSYPFTGR